MDCTDVRVVEAAFRGVRYAITSELRAADVISSKSSLEVYSTTLADMTQKLSMYIVEYAALLDGEEDTLP